MTTLDERTSTCAICGGRSKQTVVASTNARGSPDLDLRPPEMQRSTMPYWVWLRFLLSLQLIGMHTRSEGILRPNRA